MRLGMTRILAASAALALTAGVAHAETVIYQDDFSGGTGDINGTTPDVGANNWVAAQQFNADGSILNTGVTTSIQGGSATLAFTPVDGLVYTLDASLRDVAGNGNWIGFGFAEGQSSLSDLNNRFLAADTIGKAWMFMRGDTSANPHVTFLGNKAATSNKGNNDGEPFPTGFNGSDLDLRIVLDTTGGADAWTATWFAKLPASGSYTVIRAEETLLDETITSVGLVKSNDGVTGNIESFSLTSVPEPGSLALLGLGGLLIARRRRSA